MKPLAILFAFCFAAFTSSANSNGQLPIVGEKFTYHVKIHDTTQSIILPVTTNSDGLWVVRDESHNHSMEIVFDSVENHIGHSNFPNATLAVVNDQMGIYNPLASNNGCHYYRTDRGFMEKVGRVISDTSLKDPIVIDFEDTDERRPNYFLQQITHSDAWSALYWDEHTNSEVYWDNGIDQFEVVESRNMLINGVEISEIYQVERIRSFDISNAHTGTHKFKSVITEWWSPELPVPLAVHETQKTPGHANDKVVSYYLDMQQYQFLGKETIENKDEISIYPNPSNGQLNVNLGGNKSDFDRLRIYDSRGVIVFNHIIPENASNQNYSLIPSLTTGMYIVEISGTSDQVVKSWIVR